MTTRFLFLLFSVFVISSKAQEDTELSWPREVDTENGLITLYQPQLESYEANILQGRFAISYKPDDGETSFGAFWFEAFLQTDKESQIALLKEVEVMEIKFPGVEDSTQIDKVTAKLESILESTDIIMSLDRLVASLHDTGILSNSSSDLSHLPPDIYYRKEPTVLITIDGDPIWKEMGQYNLEAVVNSPFFIVKEDKTNRYFIKGGEYWYTSELAAGEGWKPAENVPSNVKKFAADNAPKVDEPSSQSSSFGESSNPNAAGKSGPPNLLVVTKPSELIVTMGEPDYQSVEGTNLLYVANSESDIILDIEAQQHYILLAGRWYKADKLSGGKWTFSEPSSLPADFSKIPDDGDLASIRSSVPGTPESRDALLQQSIPQTAEVSREDTKIEVNFDGTPKFKQVPNTEVSYAENSDKQVMKIHQKYYAVDNGIWFVSDYPEGPYAVSDERPDEVDDLPADSPVYNTRYVYVYDATPTTVYVGYTPGYTHAFVYNGVVVYGTGYYYPYWYGRVYYPRPVTYGYSVHYNPYTGWGFSFGISAGGWIGWRYHPYYRPYWGPCGYRYGYRRGYGYGYHNGYRHGYNRGVANGYARGYRAGQNNAYRNQRSGVTNTTLKNRGNFDRSRLSAKKNDHFADRDGNVFQKDKAGNWNQKSNARNRVSQSNRDEIKRQPAGDRLKPTDRATSTRDRSTNTRQSTKTRNSTKSMTKNRSTSTNRSSTSRSTYSGANRTKDLNRAAQSRQRGNTNYQRSRSAMGRGKGTRPMPKGGGMRKR